MIDALPARSFLENLLRTLDPARFDVYLWVLHGAPPERIAQLESEGVRVIAVTARGRCGYPVFVLRLVGLLRRLRIDILHTHNFESTALGILAGRVALVPALVTTRHHADVAHLSGKHWHVRIDGMTAQLADLVVANSNYTKEVLVSMEGVPEGKVRFVRYGIDQRPFRSVSAEAVNAVQAEMSLEGKLVLCVAARLDHMKGHRFLLEAMAMTLRRGHPHVVLLVAGAGPMEETLRSQARELGIEDGVRFLGMRADVPELMAASDIVVHPSLTEASGIALIEALAVGRPVVATDVGGTPEVVTHDRSGLLVPSCSSEALADAILRLVEAPELRQEMGRTARAEADRFSLQRMAEEHAAVYAELLERRPLEWRLGARSSVRSGPAEARSA